MFKKYTYFIIIICFAARESFEFVLFIVLFDNTFTKSEMQAVDNTII